MQVWRKFLAIILLIIFAPATLVAAMPLQLCLGNDGHRAVESAFSPQHHQHAAHAKSDVVGQNFDGGHSSSAGADSVPDCRDVSLHAVAQVSSRGSADADHSDGAKDSGASCPVFPHLLALALLCDSAEYGHFAQGIQRDPRLATLATVVLLN